jgi:hypothetical protein
VHCIECISTGIWYKHRILPTCLNMGYTVWEPDTAKYDYWSHGTNYYSK